MSTYRRLDFQACADLAARMSDREIAGALLDITMTLPYADRLDIAFGTGDGGYYRDEASVLRTEQGLREGGYRTDRRRIVDEGAAGPAMLPTGGCPLEGCNGTLWFVRRLPGGEREERVCEVCRSRFAVDPREPIEKMETMLRRVF